MSSRRLALRAATVLSSSSPMRRAYPATSAHKIAASRRLTCASATNVSSTKRIQDLAKPIALPPAGRTRHGNCGASDERDELGVPLVLPQSQDHALPHRVGIAALCIAGKLATDGRDGSTSVIAVMSAARPLFPRKRKSIRDLAMSP